MAIEPLYVFVDESGDFNFSPNGTKFYTITAVITHIPWEKVDEITRLRHRILVREFLPELGLEYLEKSLCRCFHATEDKQVVRDAFFNVINSMESFKAHSIVVRKNRTNPAIQEPNKFYPRIVGYLLDYIFKAYEYSKLCIFLDGMPVTKRKQLFIGTIKSEIKTKSPKTEFFIYFPQSQSNAFLQVSDYVNWAIFRKWETGDIRSYDLIKHFLGKPELDIFAGGTKTYY